MEREAATYGLDAELSLSEEREAPPEKDFMMQELPAHRRPSVLDQLPSLGIDSEELTSPKDENTFAKAQKSTSQA